MVTAEGRALDLPPKDGPLTGLTAEGRALDRPPKDGFLTALLFVCVFALIGSFGSARAQVPAVDVTTVLDGNYSRNSAAALRSTWRTQATINGATVGRTFLSAAPGGRTLAAEYAVNLTNRQIAVIGGRSIAGVVLGPVAGAAVLAWSVYDAVRIRPVPESVAPDGLAFDPGTAPTSQTTYYTTASTLTAASSQDGACARQADIYRPGLPSSYNVFPQIAPGGGCYTMAQAPTEPGYAPSPAYIYQGAYAFYSGSGLLCPAVTDPLDSANNVPAGQPQGHDGKCRTGRYTQPMTAEEAADMRTQQANTAAIDYKALMDDVLGRSTSGVPITNDFDKNVLVTPGSLNGATTTTANADGTVTEVATGWNFARDPLRTTDIVFTPKSTTTTRNSSGSIVGAPITTTGSGAAGNAATDPCVGDPGRLGCIGLGTVAEDPIGTRDVNVTITPQAGWGASTGSCPAPRFLVVQGMSVEINNSVLCDWLRGLRFVIVGMSAVAGALIFVGGLRA